MKQMIYLAGPISHLSYEEVVGWRDQVKKELSDKYACLSPMRGKEVLSHIKAFNPSGEDHDAAHRHAVFARDHCDVHRSDALFVNLLGAKRVSVFTMMEIAWAYEANKFILVVMEDNNPHDHLCIRESASMIVSTIEDGVDYFKSVLNEW